MKKLLFAALLATGFVASAFAAPAFDNNATFSFNADFKNAANVTWKTTNEYTKVSFVLNNVSMEAFYDQEGNILATSQKVAMSDVPAAFRNNLAKKYCRYNVNEAIRMDGALAQGWYLSMESPKYTMVMRVDDDGNMTPVNKHLKPGYIICGCEEE